jgi:hypothetical protein
MSLSGWLGSIIIGGMVIDMNDQHLATLAQVKAFLEGTTAVAFAVAAEERYDFIARTLQRFGYRLLPRADKGVVLRFLERVSGYSRQQFTRLVKRGAERRPLIKRHCASRTSFGCTRSLAKPGLPVPRLIDDASIAEGLPERLSLP